MEVVRPRDYDRRRFIDWEVRRVFICDDGPRGLLFLFPAFIFHVYWQRCAKLMTHKQPYAEVSLTVQAVTLVSNGIKPQKPTDPEIVKRGLNDKLWDLLCRCWNPDPEERPTIQEVLGELPKCGHFWFTKDFDIPYQYTTVAYISFLYHTEYNRKYVLCGER